ncbi:hypothetical protein GGR51DRAFT_435446 [Nemania sp. FL0031]|nr:hypothetical protein GGR51DRAFT_435446 [Nemania sp. FL0031]
MSSRANAVIKLPPSPSLGESPKYRDHQGPRQGTQRYHHDNGKNLRPQRHRRYYAHNARNGPRHKDTFSGRKNHWHSTGSLDLALEPRSFDILHAERIYLLSELHSQERQTLELFRELAALDEQINCQQNGQRHLQRSDQQYSRHRERNIKIKVKVDGVPVEEASSQPSAEEMEREEEQLRNARREYSRRRHQIRGAVDAERRLLGRLGALHVEIQCQERWCLVEQERAGVLYGPGPGYDGYGPQYTMHQQSEWWRYPYQNAPPHPVPYEYQPRPYGYDNHGGGFYQGMPPTSQYPDNTAVPLGRGYDGQEPHIELGAPVAQQGGQPDGNGSQTGNSYQVDEGEHV